jgi:ribosome-associated toxin RatA of RatAB toxin-antitoxin module
VLTDYERYPRFISSMRESKVVSRSSEGLVVEQKGSFSFLFFSQGIDVRLLVSEFPPNVIESRAIDGDFRVMNGRYELLQHGNNVRLSYSGRLVPNFSLPPIIGMKIMRYILLRNFREMVEEILRRDATARGDIQTDR